MRESFAVHDVVAAPGETTTGHCRVDLGVAEVSIPVAVVNGAAPGPVLSVTAGIHGGEYVSILAVRRFVAELDPATMSGTVLASLLSSPVAFERRQEFVNPLDGSNLNRSFPGSPDGTPTQRLADWLWTSVISRGNAYVDCHCGDLPEVLQAFAGVDLTGTEPLDTTALDLASCFSVERIIAEPATSGTTTSAAARAGIPAVLIEVGGRGLWATDEVDRQLTGLRAVAERLGILAGDSTVVRRRLPVFEVAADVKADVGGLWFPAVSPGDRVAAGATLGVVEDIFGAALSTVTSPVDGVYVYGLASLAVRPGDYLACLVRETSQQQPVERTS